MDRTTSPQMRRSNSGPISRSIVSIETEPSIEFSIAQTAASASPSRTAWIAAVTVATGSRSASASKRRAAASV